MSRVKKCQICGKPATMFLTQIVNGQVTELAFCEECARAKGLFDPQALTFAEKFFPEKFKERIDWDALSRSRHRCILTAGMFERFKAYWNWKILSSNSDVELDFELIDRFADRWDWRELIDRHRDDLLNREFFERYKTYIPASELQHSRLWHNLVDERKLQLAREITI